MRQAFLVGRANDGGQVCRRASSALLSAPTESIQGRATSVKKTWLLPPAVVHEPIHAVDAIAHRRFSPDGGSRP